MGTIFKLVGYRSEFVSMDNRSLAVAALFGFTEATKVVAATRH